MVVLEALSVGTPVLINSVCGQANEIELVDPQFVYEGEDSEALIHAFRKRKPNKVDIHARTRIRNTYRMTFGIESVWNILESFYERSFQVGSHEK
jgi:glycosyltransferase involved in cell wall biosynthesis